MYHPCWESHCFHLTDTLESLGWECSMLSAVGKVGGVLLVCSSQFQKDVVLAMLEITCCY